MRASGIWNHPMASDQALAGSKATPMSGTASGTSGTSTSSSDSATISANDFLTLLVTEMKNQDPTASTDPNEYINQLVSVNSLEQLISINQNVSTALGTSSTSSSKTSASAQAINSTDSPAGKSAGSIAQIVPAATHKANALAGTPSPGTAAIAAGSSSSSIKLAPGNLSVPKAKPAAQRVAQSLGGHHQVR